MFPYWVEIGFYGIYEPTTDPAVKWIWLACFSTPGLSYDGFSLMYLDVVVNHGDGESWLSYQGDRDRGLCDVNKGVDTTFVEIPRNLDVKYVIPVVTPDEMNSMNVIVGRQIVNVPHTFR